MTIKIEEISDSALKSILAFHPELIKKEESEEDIIYKEANEQYSKLPIMDIIHGKFKTIISKEPGKKTQFIRENLPILLVASKYGLKIRHNKCVCPLHIDTDPSLVFYPETNSFFCFGERKGGDVIEFIRRMEEIQEWID